MDKKPDFLLKNKTFKQHQESIIKQISKNCTKSTFVEKIISNGTEISHFKLSDGTHVYSTAFSESHKPSRLISSIELPNITYFPHHWNPSLLPDNDFSKINGTYIHVNTNNISYSSYSNGQVMFNVGYNFNLKKPDAISYFCNFDQKHFGKTFSTLPNNVETILQLLENWYNRFGSKKPKLSAIYTDAKNILMHLENGTVNELPILKNQPIILDNVEPTIKPTEISNSDNSIYYLTEYIPSNMTPKQNFHDSLKVDTSDFSYVSPTNPSSKKRPLIEKIRKILKGAYSPDRNDE